jgi:hypothetical protein
MKWKLAGINEFTASSDVAQEKQGFPNRLYLTLRNFPFKMPGRAKSTTNKKQEAREQHDTLMQRAVEFL